MPELTLVSLNYDARRMALFLGIAAVVDNDKQLLFRLLRDRDFVLFKRVVSFL